MQLKVGYISFGLNLDRHEEITCKMLVLNALPSLFFEVQIVDVCSRGLFTALGNGWTEAVGTMAPISPRQTTPQHSDTLTLCWIVSVMASSSTEKGGNSAVHNTKIVLCFFSLETDSQEVGMNGSDSGTRELLGVGRFSPTSVQSGTHEQVDDELSRVFFFYWIGSIQRRRCDGGIWCVNQYSGRININPLPCQAIICTLMRRKRKRRRRRRLCKW